MRVGIPNRSSLLHLAGVLACVNAGLISISTYHAARLAYRTAAGRTFLTRCSGLCGMLANGELDAVFVGDDYWSEYGAKDCDRVPFPVLSAQFALLSACPDVGRLAEVYTKFPVTARSWLERWGVQYERIVFQPGGVETFALNRERAAAFDVVCTGGTVRVNRLSVLRAAPRFTSAWYVRRGVTLPASLHDPRLATRLRQHFDQRLVDRDREAQDTLQRLVSEPRDA